MDEKILELYSWVLLGSQRVKVVKALNVPKTPMLIRKETQLNFGNVSNVLKVLSEKGIVVCLNPDSHLGKLYKLTEIGEKISEMLKNL